MRPNRVVTCGVSESDAGLAAEAACFFAASDFRLPRSPPAFPPTELLLFAAFFAAISSADLPLAVMTSGLSPEVDSAGPGVAGEGVVSGAAASAGVAITAGTSPFVVATASAAGVAAGATTASGAGLFCGGAASAAIAVSVLSPLGSAGLAPAFVS